MLSIALFDQGKAFAQAPQSKFAEVNGVNGAEQFTLTANGCTDMPKPAICGCR